MSDVATTLEDARWTMSLRDRLTDPAARPALLRATLKRAFDLLVACAALLATLPVFLVIALAIKLDSPGPVFYRAERVGHRGARLRMLKFRKMRDDAAGLPLTAAADQRFTRVGLWLARLKLDELPQFINVLRGEMSLIGPRPEDPAFVAMHPLEYAEILSVKPGITGLSQLAFAEESRILDDEDPLAHYLERILPQKLGMDALYARRQTLRLDLAVLGWTVTAVVLRREVAVHRETGRMNLRKRKAPQVAPAPAPVALLEAGPPAPSEPAGAGSGS